MYQPLAEDKGVYREVESEGSLRQILGSMYKKLDSRQYHLDKLAFQSEVPYNQKMIMYIKRVFERKVIVLTRGGLYV